MSRDDWQPLLDDLAFRRDAARAMGGAERLERHRKGGRLDARARVDHLLDDGSFVELGTLVGSVQRGASPVAPADALVAGHGLIEGRPRAQGSDTSSCVTSNAAASWSTSSRPRSRPVRIARHSRTSR